MNMASLIIPKLSTTCSRNLLVRGTTSNLRLTLQPLASTAKWVSPRSSCASLLSWRPFSSDNDDASTNNTDQQQRKRLDVAIVGLPNAGKSQLLNVMTQSSVAAVSRKRHTTRDGILGARTLDGDTQLVFIDTPGFLRRKEARKEGLLNELIESASNEMKYADYTLIVIDSARALRTDVKETLAMLMLQAKYSEGRVEAHLDADTIDEEDDDLQHVDPVVRFQMDPKEKFAIILNKVDLVNPKRLLLEIATEVGAMADEVLMYSGEQDSVVESETNEEIDTELLARVSPPIFYVSALKEDGVNDILKYLKVFATPCKAWAVEPGEVTDRSPVERVGEVIREKIYRSLHKEVPHQVKQVNRDFQFLTHKETGQRAMRIDQELVVKTKSHHRLVLGRGGGTLKKIKESAQKDIEEMFDCVVSLQLNVKLQKTQHDRPYEASEIGIQREIARKDLNE